MRFYDGQEKGRGVCYCRREEMEEATPNEELDGIGCTYIITILTEASVPKQLKYSGTIITC